jgi:hypothetical protein
MTRHQENRLLRLIGFVRAGPDEPASPCHTCGTQVAGGRIWWLIDDKDECQTFCRPCAMFAVYVRRKEDI